MASVMAGHMAQEMGRTFSGNTEEDEDAYTALENFLEGKLAGGDEQDYFKAIQTGDWGSVANLVEKAITDLDLSLEDIKEAGISLPDDSKIGKDWKLNKDPSETRAQNELEPSSMDDSEVGDWMKRNESPPRKGKISDLDQLEMISRIKYKNIELEYADDEGTRGLVKEYVKFLGRSDVPEAFTRYTKKVSFSAQAAHSRHRYTNDYNIGLDGKPIMGAAYADIYGNIVVGVTVGTNPRVVMGTMAHETGHNFAAGFWGDLNPPKNSRYGMAQAKEPPVSSYGATNPAEDFSEACQAFFGGTVGMSPERFARKFPLKHAALVDLFINKNFEVPEGGWDNSAGASQKELKRKLKSDYKKKLSSESPQIPEGWSSNSNL